MEDVKSEVRRGVARIGRTIFELMAKGVTNKDKEELVRKWGLEQSTTVQKPSAASVPIAEPAVSASQPGSAVATAATVTNNAVQSKGLASQGTNAVNSVSTSTSMLFHPVLGERLTDLGYKTLYLTNVRALVSAPVWRKQRILRPERASLIAKDKIKNGLGGSLPGSIIMFMDKGIGSIGRIMLAYLLLILLYSPDSGEIGIVDGQHRAAALMILAEKGHWDLDKRNILVEVFFTSRKSNSSGDGSVTENSSAGDTLDDMEVARLFREINSAEPVLLIDLPQEEELEAEIKSSASDGEQQTSYPESDAKEQLATASGTASKKRKSTRSKRISQEEIREIINLATEELKIKYYSP